MSSSDNRVLIVDDESVILDILQEHLGSKGYDCAVASSAAEALTQLRAVETALLLTDIVMPQVSGLEILESVRADEKLVGLPVIILTATTDSQVKAKALDARDRGPGGPRVPGLGVARRRG